MSMHSGFDEKSVVSVVRFERATRVAGTIDQLFRAAEWVPDFPSGGGMVVFTDATMFDNWNIARRAMQQLEDLANYMHADIIYYDRCGCVIIYHPTPDAMPVYQMRGGVNCAWHKTPRRKA